MCKRARLIYNPSSGRELFHKYIPRILDKMERSGYETSCHATSGRGDATLAAEMAVARRFDLVVAAGGDGTVNEVVNGLAGKTYRPQLGIIPAGTTNDFARALGLPKDFEAACDVILHGQTASVDVGQVDREYFINIAGGGTLTELTYEVPSRFKTVFGQLAYYVKGIEKLALLKPTHVTMVTKDRVIDEEIMLFLVANSNSVGGFEKLAPRAQMDDGYFDILVVRKTTMAEFLKIATKAIRGEHIYDPRVIYFQASELMITSEEKVRLNLDGERGGHLPSHFKVLHKHLTLRIPR